MFCHVLQVWDLKDLGLQASQRIAQASDPLRLLKDISQNFPTLAASLSRLPVNASLAAEVKSNQRSLPAGNQNLPPLLLPHAALSWPVIMSLAEIPECCCLGVATCLHCSGLC